VIPRQGECFSSSLDDPRSDTWRCIADLLYDPCFKSQLIRNYVICVPAPWVRKVYGMKGQFDYSGRASFPGHAWGIRLLDGHRCEWLSGATTVRHGKRLNYGCDRGGYLFGLPKGGHAYKRIAFARGPHTPLRWKKIKRIWR
jgi:eukaryotic-like serine/threonine-protein kinase